MLRNVARRGLMMRATPVLRLQSGFAFVEDQKVEDIDINSSVEQKLALNLTLTRQEESIFRNAKVKSVVVQTETGDIGVLPNHAYTVAKLIPGIVTVEIEDGKTEKFFTSGGFAHINNEGSMDINTVECIPLDDFDLSAVEKELAAALDMKNSGKNEKARAIGDIQVGVLESLQTALKGL